jgi:signal peptidase I
VRRERLDAYRYRDSSGWPTAVTAYREYLPGGRSHTIIERSDLSFADTMAEVTVPDHHVFMMGDNRDNSADSRFVEMGFVPLENLRGRAELITYSLYHCTPSIGLTCASRRYLTPID